jgi:hypothetical protein
MPLAATLDIQSCMICFVGVGVRVATRCLCIILISLEGGEPLLK